MRRVVVTGMGIVSCLGNDAHGVDAVAARRALRHPLQCRNTPSVGLRSQVGGAVEIDLDAADRPQAARFMGDAAAYAYVAMQRRDRRCRPQRRRQCQSAHRPDRRFRRRIQRQRRSKPPTSCASRACARSARTWCRARCAAPCRPAWPPRFEHQGPQLFHLLRLRDLRALHRHGSGADPAWGKQDIIFAGGGEDLRLEP